MRPTEGYRALDDTGLVIREFPARACVRCGHIRPDAARVADLSGDVPASVRRRCDAPSSSWTEPDPSGRLGRARACAENVLDGRYQVGRELGAGAAGRVFEAVNLFTGRRVAIKISSKSPLPELRVNHAARLLREAHILASLRHPNIVQAFDGGTVDGHPYLVMELLEGPTVDDLLTARGRLSVEDTVSMALSLCDALTCAHEAGIVHRDMKPSNVVVTKDAVKLLDFGIARVHAHDAPKLTAFGGLLGTPAYMSPEQLLGTADIDPRADIYGLSVMMFECLTGFVPYEGHFPQVLLRVCSTAGVPRVSDVRTDVPAALVATIERGMARERNARFRTAADFAAAIAAVAAEPRSSGVHRCAPPALVDDGGARARPGEAAPLPGRPRTGEAAVLTVRRKPRPAA